MATTTIPVHTTVHRFSHLIGLVVMAAALGLSVLAAQPPAPKPVTAPANEFSAARALALEARLLGDGAPHPIGSEANARVRQRIIGELTALGYSVETQDTFACRTEYATCGYVTNVMARLPGRTAGPAVLLTAHYDSVPAGPGAADDMAGVAAILEIARILRAEAPPRNPIIFLLSDGEEPILLGAEGFVAEHPWAADIGVVVNLEAGGTRGPSILFETTEHNAWLISAFAARAPKPVASSVYDVVWEFLPHNTDLDVYEEAGRPGINLAFFEERAHYHTPLDSLANLDPGSVQHHGDNALAAVRTLAERDLSAPPAGKSVYLDVLPGVVVHWPEPWTIWLALACLLAWLGLAASLIRRGEVSLRALLWGLVVLPLGVLGAAVLGLALAFGISRLTGSAEPWYAYPLPTHAALWAAALLSLALVATAVAGRAGFWGVSLGVWLGWGLLSLLMAWWMPGVSVMFVLPTALATLVLAAVGFTPLRASPRAREIAAMVALFGASWIWLAFALHPETGDGPAFALGPMVAIAVGLAASALAPLFAIPVEHGRMRRPKGLASRRWVLAGAALLTVAAAGVALRMPPYSELRPQRLNLLHFEDRHSDQAYWVIDSPWLADNRAVDTPEALRQAERFDSEPAAVLPWSNRRYLVAPTTRTAAPAPAVHVLGDDRVGGERVLQLELRSPRGGHQVSLYIPQAAGLKRIAVVGTPYTIERFRLRDGYQAFHCFAPACNGLKLALHVENDAPLAMFVVDVTPGLPPGGEELIQARPKTATPSSGGDVTLIADHVSFDAP